MKGITKFGTEQEITITEPMTKDQWRSIGKQLGYPLRENKPKTISPSPPTVPVIPAKEKDVME